jgi:DNA-binding NarL/FixJ family response regulator
MLSEVVKSAFESQPDIEVVEETQGLGRVEESVRRSRPDIVIVADSRNKLPKECLHLMYEHVRLKVLVVTPDGLSASIHRLAPVGTVIDDVSPQGLLEAVRTAASAAER